MDCLDELNEDTDHHVRPVFCYHCRFRNLDAGPTVTCRHPSAQYEVRTPLLRHVRTVPTAVRNAHNDCADYVPLTVGHEVHELWTAIGPYVGIAVLMGLALYILMLTH